MQLELKKKVLKVDVYGVEENMNFPTVIERKDYLIDLYDEKNNEYDVSVKFFEMLGMSRESIDTLDLPDMQEIIEVLTSKKKV
jgi:hypothetical protein